MPRPEHDLGPVVIDALDRATECRCLSSRANNVDHRRSGCPAPVAVPLRPLFGRLEFFG